MFVKKWGGGGAKTTWFPIIVLPPLIYCILYDRGDRRRGRGTHVDFDNRTGNYSFLDPILMTDSINIIDSDTIHIDRECSDHDRTYVTIGCFTLFRCCLYFDSVSTDFTLRKVLRKRSRIRISLLKVEFSDPQNDFKLSYESIEKAEILNKYFSSISNSNDENKVLPDFDCRCLNVLSDIEVFQRKYNIIIKFN
jgi:hypothetical protein